MVQRVPLIRFVHALLNVDVAPQHRQEQTNSYNRTRGRTRRTARRFRFAGKTSKPNRKPKSALIVFLLSRYAEHYKSKGRCSLTRDCILSSFTKSRRRVAEAMKALRFDPKQCPQWREGNTARFQYIASAGSSARTGQEARYPACPTLFRSCSQARPGALVLHFRHLFHHK